jgi:hypothetical protein
MDMTATMIAIQERCLFSTKASPELLWFLREITFGASISLEWEVWWAGFRALGAVYGGTACL